MLRLLLGRAGGGKTSHIIDEIKSRASNGEKSVLIVPEQYSHDAERLLAAVGAEICLYAEILSFSRLCTRVLTECGGASKKTLDAGGRVLVMSRVMSEISGALEALKSAGRTEYLESLVRAVSELRYAGITPEKLLSAAENGEDGPFASKLRDMAAVLEGYMAMIPDGMCDPTEHLELLAEKLTVSGFGRNEAVFVDGFSDFTAQELAVLTVLLKKGTEITVCLCCENLSDERSEDALPLRTAERLLRAASDVGSGTDIAYSAAERTRAPELAFIDDNLFGSDAVTYDGENTAVSLYSAASVFEECEAAAAEVLKFVRAGNRLRDIAVAAPSRADYAGIAENVFEKYGIPVQLSEKSDILQKPVMAFPLAALDVVCSGWDSDAVMRCLKTELFGEERSSRDALENYLLKWNIRGSKLWRSGDWKMNPSGYADTFKDGDKEELAIVNSLRADFAEKLGRLEDALKASLNSSGCCQALYGFLNDTDFSRHLTQKAEALRECGRLRLADEYGQLWEILVSALEQLSAVTGEMQLSPDEFSAQLRLLLSQYEIGSIPVSLDRVSIGDLTRIRRRGVKMLIILGCSDDRLPSGKSAGGSFSENERTELKRRGIEIGGDHDDSYERELYDISASFSLPSERLTVMYPKEGGKLPSYLVSRISDMLGAEIKEVTPEIRLEAEKPCFEAALSHCDIFSASAREYYRSDADAFARIEAIGSAAVKPRGRLERLTAEKLYGRSIGLTASKADKFGKCRFSYFLQYGLRAKPRTEAVLDSLQVGTFMHYVLEKVCKKAGHGGFARLSDDDIRALVRKYTAEFAEQTLGGLNGKSGRFRYLFARLSRDAENTAIDMAGELRVSSFEPLAFELDFSQMGELPPAQVSDGSVTVTVTGKADRVDGWLKDGRLYLRVVDYKTGKKSFSMQDVRYGLGIQLLIYLFALSENGHKKFGNDIVPAGVMYVPARDVFVSADVGTTDEEIEKKRAGQLKRSGIFLDNEEVIEAMEHGEKHRYLPISIRGKSDALVSAERLGLLAKHIDAVLLEMGREISRGKIEAEPLYQNERDNSCLWCDYCEVCRFGESSGDRHRYLPKLKSAEAWQQIEKEVQNV